jgi:carbon storage regulator CsrA
MLVLARKINESIRIGENIVLKVIAIQEGQVKIGLEAPIEIKILRQEVYEEVLKNNMQAASARKDDAVNVVKRLSKRAIAGQVNIDGIQSIKQKKQS